MTINNIESEAYITINRGLKLPLVHSTVDSDSHVAKKIGFVHPETGQYSNIIFDSGKQYTLEYAEPFTYSGETFITKAQGIFLLDGTEPLLEDATVWYADGTVKTNGEFWVSLFEDTIVVDETSGERQTIQFIEKPKTQIERPHFA